MSSPNQQPIMVTAQKPNPHSSDDDQLSTARPHTENCPTPVPTPQLPASRRVTPGAIDSCRRRVEAFSLGESGAQEAVVTTYSWRRYIQEVASNPQSVARPSTSDPIVESSQSDRCQTPTLGSTHQDQSQPSQDVQAPCIVDEHPTYAREIFCHTSAPPHEPRTDYTKTKGTNPNSDFMKTFLLLTLGTRAAYDSNELPSPRHDKANGQVKQVVEVIRCSRAPEPEQVKIFYCVVGDKVIDSKTYSVFSVVPKDAPISSLPLNVFGRKTNIDSRWFLDCSVCSRTFMVKVCVK